MHVLTQELIHYIQQFGFSEKQIEDIINAIESWHKDHAVTIWSVIDIQHEAKVEFGEDLSIEECRDILSDLQRRVCGGITWVHIDIAIEEAIKAKKEKGETC